MRLLEIPLLKPSDWDLYCKLQSSYKCSLLHERPFRSVPFRLYQESSVIYKLLFFLRRLNLSIFFPGKVFNLMKPTKLKATTVPSSLISPRTTYMDRHRVACGSCGITAQLIQMESIPQVLFRLMQLPLQLLLPQPPKFNRCQGKCMRIGTTRMSTGSGWAKL